MIIVLCALLMQQISSCRSNSLLLLPERSFVKIPVSLPPPSRNHILHFPSTSSRTSIVHHIRGGARSGQTSSVVSKSSDHKVGQIDKFLNNILKKADTNKDGKIDLDEAYILILKLSIMINRQAPIDPPTRKKLLKYFNTADKDKSKQLSKEEFKVLASTMSRRALSLIVIYKTTKMFLAPVLAMAIVRTIASHQGMQNLLNDIVPDAILEINTLKRTDFWTPVLCAIFIATLGKISMSLVTLIFDILAGINDDDGNDELE